MSKILSDDEHKKLEFKKKSGIEPHEYNFSLSDELSDYQCMICTNLINKATEIKTCGHIFCENCIYRWNETNDTCPLCKTEFDSESDLVESKFIDRKVGQVNVNCPFCDWKGLYIDFVKHIDPTYKEPCRYLIVKCKKCSVTTKHESMEQHIKETCFFRTIPCDQCKIEIKYNDKNHHIESECLETEIKCNELCDFKGKRNEYILHKNICIFEKIPCPLNYVGCTEMIERRYMDKHVENSLESHFAIAAEKIKDQEIEINNLKTRLLNYEPIDPKYKLVVGQMIKYQKHHKTYFCTILSINGEILELGLDSDSESNIIKINRNSDHLRLLQ